MTIQHFKYEICLNVLKLSTFRTVRQDTTPAP